jgi:hypothetical protein
MDLNSGPLHHQPVFCHQTKEDTLIMVTMQILIYTRAIDVWSAVSSPLGGLYIRLCDIQPVVLKRISNFLLEIYFSFLTLICGI